MTGAVATQLEVAEDVGFVEQKLVVPLDAPATARPQIQPPSATLDQPVATEQPYAQVSRVFETDRVEHKRAKLPVRTVSAPFT